MYNLFYSICQFCQIVNWRNHLKFPEEARLTPEAKDLICRLLCNVEHRLGVGGAHQIKVRFIFIKILLGLFHLSLLCLVSNKTLLCQSHPWFKDVVWDKLYEMEAAFKPEVNGELDTQNFMKFDEVLCNFTFHFGFYFIFFLLLYISFTISQHTLLMK